MMFHVKLILTPWGGYPPVAERDPRAQGKIRNCPSETALPSAHNATE